MSDADRQHVHRQQNNGQDEHAANGGSNPGFRGLVHAVVPAVKRRGGRCMGFLGHWLRPLGLVELCSPSKRDTIKLRKTPELKCRSFMKSIALTYAHTGQSQRTHRERGRTKGWPRTFAQNERKNFCIRRNACGWLTLIVPAAFSAPRRGD